MRFLASTFIHFCMASKTATYLVIFFFALTLKAQNSAAIKYGLPSGNHPHLRELIGTEPDEDDGLNSEIKNLGNQIKSTVKTVTAKRSFSCYGQPCNIKAFPLMYTKRYSGFWGGARAKLTNDSRNDPYLYAIDLNVQRSDTQQSEIAIGFDLPRVQSVPYHPRLKLEFTALKNNEVRYWGQSEAAKYYENNLSKIDQTRFNIEQYQIESLMSFRVAVIREQTYSVFGGFHSTTVNTSPFLEANKNQLYYEKPRAHKGGVGGAWTIGLISDSRDSEFLAKSGWMIEGGISVGGSPIGNFKFTRIFLNDRRFFSYKKSTLAHRLTFDVLSGDVPFWETKRVAGLQPVSDIASSDLLRSYFRGRFHETFKIVESLEWRYRLGKVWLFGLKPDMIFVPTALNFGQLGDSKAWSVSSGSYFAFSNSFLAQLFTGYSPTGWDFSLLFGVNI